MAAAIHRRGLSTAAGEGVASPRLRVRGKTYEQMARLLAGDQTGGDRPRGCLRAQHGRRTFARYQPLTGERTRSPMPAATASTPQIFCHGVLLKFWCQVPRPHLAI